MGWSRTAAYSHAQRLEHQRWITRRSTLPGEGSLLAATRTGIRMLGLPVAASPPPAPMWWAHLRGCAWTAAWLTADGREIQGPREVDADPSWSGEVRWREQRGQRKGKHQPDLAWLVAGRRIAVEVELARKSTARLNGILELHARWYASGHTAGVIYVCAESRVSERVVELADSHGLGVEKGSGLRVELLDAVRQEAQRGGTSAMASRVRRNRAAGFQLTLTGFEGGQGC